MEVTLFPEYVSKWFRAITKRITETINGSKEAPKYLFQSMLRKEYSPDLKWEQTNIDKSIVAADIVSMDSELPLKKRDSLGRASGDLPKSGMKLIKGEKDISNINIMRARGANETQIVQKIFNDVPKCVSGIYERMEYVFLKGLSTGMGLVPDSDNVGTGIRIKYNYLDKNKFGVTVKWGEEGYAPLSDISRVLETASAAGHTIIKIMLSRAAFNKIRTSQQGKELAANFAGQVIISAATLPTPTPEKFKDAFRDEYGVELETVDRSVRIEKNGKQTPVKPFAENALVFLTTDQVGTLFYGTLAEETNPVKSVEYQKVDDYILVSKYSKNDPLQEFTSSQALVVPIIENVEEIYLLDTDDAQPVNPAETEGDANITVYDKKYVKAEVINVMKGAGIKVAVNISDAKLIEKINTLSAEDEAKVKAAIEALTPVTE